MTREREFYREAVSAGLPAKEDIRAKVLGGARQKRKKHSWLAPVAACLLGAVVICTAVPPVRAAITQWFRDNFSVENYLAQPAEERPSTPELDAVIEKSAPEEKIAWSGIEITNVAPEWQEWVAALNPGVGDVFFDGRTIIAGFDMGGGAMEFMNDYYWNDDNPISVSFNDIDYFTMNGEKYGHSPRVDISWSVVDSYAKYHIENPDGEQRKPGDGSLTAEGYEKLLSAESVPFTVTISHDDYNNIMDTLAASEGREYDELLSYVNERKKSDPEYTPEEFKFFDADTQLDGVQNVEVRLDMTAYDHHDFAETEDGYIELTKDPVRIATLVLKFSFNPDAGTGNDGSFEINAVKELSGDVTYNFSQREDGYVTVYNKTQSLDGGSIAVKNLNSHLTGAELYISLKLPDGWTAAEKESFINTFVPKVLGDGAQLPSSGMQFGLAEDGEDEGLCISLDMLPSELEAIKKFEIVPIVGYYTGYDNAEFVEGVPTKISEGDFTGWQEESTELTDNTLKFTLG